MKPAITQSSLRDLLRQRGLSFEAASVLADVDTSVISRIVNGKRQARPETIVKFARALGVSPRRLQAMADAAYDRQAPGRGGASMTGRLLLLWVLLGVFRITEHAGLTLAQVRKLPAAVDVTTAARALGMSRSAMYEAIAEGRCPVQTITVGRRIRVLTHSLIATLEGGQAMKSA